MKDSSRLFVFLSVCLSTIAVIFFTLQGSSVSASQGVLTAKSSGERLIAKNVSSSAAIWCGNDDLVLDASESDLYLFKLSSGVGRTLANSGDIGSISCSFDAKWLIAIDSSSSRYDTASTGDEGYSHVVKDYFRVNLESGEKERFAIAQGGGYWSPDGTKVLFLGKEPNSSIKQPTPQFEMVWSHDWPSGTGGVAAWMPDSKELLLGHSGVFYLQRDQNMTPLKAIFTRSLENIVQIKIDSKKHIYVSTTDTKSLSMMYQLLKCSIDSTQVNCVKVAAASAGPIAFDISQDGRHLVYVDSDHSHLYLVDQASSQSKVIAENIEGDPAISPDGRSVVFYRLSDVNKEGMGFDIHNAFIAPLN